jgi:hypothetical protein
VPLLAFGLHPEHKYKVHAKIVTVVRYKRNDERGVDRFVVGQAADDCTVYAFCKEALNYFAMRNADTSVVFACICAYFYSERLTCGHVVFYRLY